jgi:serine/threonine protein kinase
MILEQGFPPAAGTIIDDKLVVTEFIGSGGMGVVLAARDRALGRLVAIKFLHPELAAAPETVARFLREARATSRLKSEHVVRIIDVGTLPNGIPYFVMEHLTGMDLLTRLQERGPFSIDEVLDYVLQALEAIAEAHRRGIVHRDLKPANLVLTTREDDSDLIKVLDFGTSKLTSSERTVSELITRSGSLLGSPLYMSPEQIRNSSDVDARSDIWSLGVVMHELLTGHPPFQGNFLGDIISSICGDDYALPAREDLPAELAEILMRCLAKDPEERFQSAEELARAFWPIMRTVASQVSIERILRVPSSAPPPHPDLLLLEDLTIPRFPVASLADTVGSATSVAPHERDARDSRGPRARRFWLTPVAILALAAAGGITWLHLRTEPIAQVDSVLPAATPPARAMVATLPPPASTGGRSPANSVEQGVRATVTRPFMAQTRSAAGAARTTLVPQASTSAPRPQAARPELRTLDGENPFANK